MNCKSHIKMHILFFALQNFFLNYMHKYIHHSLLINLWNLFSQI